MAVFAIGDLHLPGGAVKPMDIFGSHWEGHFEKIKADWRARVRQEDLVLIPGDISWAMHLEDAMPDIEEIGSLPGTKLLLKGNHDYWWSSLTRIRACFPPSVHVLQNDAWVAENLVVCGTRGWLLPAPDAPLSPEDEKIYQRELIRMEMSLTQGIKQGGGKPVLAMTHYPPMLSPMLPSGFTELFERYHVRAAIYGHLHGAGIQNAFCGDRNGVGYQLVSCDALKFRLLEIVPNQVGI